MKTIDDVVKDHMTMNMLKNGTAGTMLLCRIILVILGHLATHK